MPARRLYVHIGLQKTGTTFLQAVMLGNAQELAVQGLDLVPPTKREAFELMLLVRDRYQPGRDHGTAEQAFDRFSRQLDKAQGSRALLSQESLAASRPKQVRRFLEACGDREVHVIATVRDLGRQVPSAWQQDLKAGRTAPYLRFLTQLREMEAKRSGSHPWIHLDPPAVLARWREHLPAEQVHVVTVPPSGSPPGLLLERFCRVIDVDPSRLTTDDVPRNTSLGRTQAEVLRRVNAELPDEVLRRQVYGAVGKRFLASQVLGDQDPERIRVPTDLRSWCEAVTERQVAELEDAGYPVEGSLYDLRCPDLAFSDEEWRPQERDVAASAVTALARVLVLRAEERREEGMDQADPVPTLPRRVYRRLRGR